MGFERPKFNPGPEKSRQPFGRREAHPPKGGEEASIESGGLQPPQEGSLQKLPREELLRQLNAVGVRTTAENVKILVDGNLDTRELTPKDRYALALMEEVKRRGLPLEEPESQ